MTIDASNTEERLLPEQWPDVSVVLILCLGQALLLNPAAALHGSNQPEEPIWH